MPTYDEWKTTDVEGERAADASERASDLCCKWVREEIAALPDIIGPWREDETEPQPTDAVVSQYRFWLTETAHRVDSPDSRALFEGVLHEQQMQDWEENRGRAEARWSR